MMGSTLNLAYSGGGGASVVTLEEFYTKKSSAGGEITHSVPTSLSQSRGWMAATTAGDYALAIGGGGTNYVIGTVYSNVDAYTASGVKTTAPSLATARAYHSAGTFGNLALVGAGTTASFNSVLNTVETISDQLVRGAAANLSSTKIDSFAARAGVYLLFAGGRGTNYTPTSSTDYYTPELVHGTATPISTARWNSGKMPTIDGTAILAGGAIGDNYQGRYQVATVDAFSPDLVRSVLPDMAVSRGTCATGATIGSYALIAGYDAAQVATTKVDTYNENFVHGTAPDLGYTPLAAGSMAVGGYAFFVGAQNVANVETFTADLTHGTAASLSSVRPLNRQCTSLGEAGFAFGGYPSDVVDLYGSKIPNVFTIPAGARYKFNGIHSTEQTAAATTTLSYEQAISGYIKLPSLTLSGEHANPTLVASI